LGIARFVFNNMGNEISAKKQHFGLLIFHTFLLVKSAKNEMAKYLSEYRLYLFF